MLATSLPIRSWTDCKASMICGAAGLRTGGGCGGGSKMKSSSGAVSLSKSSGSNGMNSISSGGAMAVVTGTVVLAAEDGDTVSGTSSATGGRVSGTSSRRGKICVGKVDNESTAVNGGGTVVFGGAGDEAVGGSKERHQYIMCHIPVNNS